MLFRYERENGIKDTDIDDLAHDYAIKFCRKSTDNVIYFMDLYVLLSWETESEEDI